MLALPAPGRLEQLPLLLREDAHVELLGAQQRGHGGIGRLDTLACSAERINGKQRDFIKERPSENATRDGKQAQRRRIAGAELLEYVLVRDRERFDCCSVAFVGCPGPTELRAHNMDADGPTLAVDVVDEGFGVGLLDDGLDDVRWEIARKLEPPSL